MERSILFVLLPAFVLMGWYLPGQEMIYGDNGCPETRLLFAEGGSRDIWVLGASVRDLSAMEAKRLGITGGVMVIQINAGGTLSNQTRMREGFVITNLGGLPVLTVAGLKDAIKRQKSHFTIQGVYPGKKQVYYYEIHRF